MLTKTFQFSKITRRLSIKIIGAFSAGNNLTLSEGTSQSEILSVLKSQGFTAKPNSFRMVTIADKTIGVIGLGPKEMINSSVIRDGTEIATKKIIELAQNENCNIIYGNYGNGSAIGEGAALGSYQFFGKKTRNLPKNVQLSSVDDSRSFKDGMTSGNAQNIARKLMETPANYLTPTLFADTAVKMLADRPNVVINIHDQKWIEKERMGSFLSVSRGSMEPLKFVELIYNGGNKGDKPLGLVGKGVTFDSGGISLKPSAGMALMKGDMGGAAVALAAFNAIVQLQLPLNVVVGIPLCENMPSGTATKPGDVVIARNGLSIEVDNTDAEGRLILADAVNYISTNYNPRALIELSTLTGAMDIALGFPFAGVFSNCDELWSHLEAAGLKTSDRFWRMPLDASYRDQIKSDVADLKNVGGKSAGACTAAVFIEEFVPQDTKFAHIDIAGVMSKDGKTMSGRPCRAIIEYATSICN